MSAGVKSLSGLILWPRTAARWVLGTDGGVPVMARPTFRYDLLSTIFAAVGAGAMMTQLTSQFARRDLGCSEWTVALLISLSSLGNFLTTFFARPLAREKRVQLMAFSRFGIGVFLACLALLPAEEHVIGAFVALLVVPYLLASLIMNAQSNVRHSNYPRSKRSGIFSRLSIVEMSSLAITAMLAGAALDRWDWGHRLVFGVAAACMILSAQFSLKMRHRRERALLRDGLTRPIGIWSGFRLLVEDRAYGAYMGWQMLFGIGNIMVAPVLTLVMTNYLKVSYAQGMLAMTLVPTAAMIATTPLAGWLIDRLHVTHYRSTGSALWAASRVLVYLGVVVHSWPLVLIAFAVQGLGQSMGNMTWNLGHMYFTSPRRSQDYMGINLTLQGIRGLLAPIAGIALLQLPGVGLSTLLIGAGVMFVASLGFYTMRPPEPLEE